jgi:succinate dehydrogenase/fumarate reductase flavoprotein subunit
MTLSSLISALASARAALSSAISTGLKVIVTEKEAVLGGTTAWSGGWMWTPRNPLAQRAGIVEDPEAPRAYLRNVLGNNFNEAKVAPSLRAPRIWWPSSRITPRFSSSLG